ncbi:MAG: transposase [Tissierella sp.]|nr:transposase [Tissierella sp.]
MSKYSFEFKLKVVKEYLEGETGGYKSIAKKHGVKSDSQVEDWVKNYEEYGEEELRRKPTKTFYSGEFKLRVLQYRQHHNCSYREAANHFGIRSQAIIATWQRKYLDEGFEGLNKSIGRPSTMSENKKEKDALNLNKSEKEELIKLREENEFLRASLAYEKKLKALVHEREQRTRKKRK